MSAQPSFTSSQASASTAASTENQPTARPAAPHGAPQTNPSTSAPALHGAPPDPTAHHGAPSTAPGAKRTQNRPKPPLPERRLAAIRLLAVGHRPCAVAACLKLDRHTLLRWRREDDFQRDLLRFHAYLAESAQPPAPAPQPLSPSDQACSTATPAMPRADNPQEPSYDLPHPTSATGTREGVNRALER